MRFQVVTPDDVEEVVSWDEAVSIAQIKSIYDLEAEFAYAQELDISDNILREVYFFRGEELVKASARPCKR